MCVAAALAVATPAPQVLAASAALTTAPSSSDEQIKRAEELYAQGTAKFETADYKAAIELWSKAYEAVPADPAFGEIKALLLYNIATAREKAFEVYGELAELKQAEILLSNFEKSVPTIYEDETEREAELAKVRERKAKIAEKIAEASEPEEIPEEPPPEGPPPEELPPEEPPPPDEPEPDPTAKLFVGLGAGLIVVGAGGLGLMAGGMAIGSQANDISELAPTQLQEREDQFAKGRTGNALAIAGGVVGGVFLATGVALLVVGKRRQSRKQTALTPALGPGFAGLQLRGRF